MWWNPLMQYFDASVPTISIEKQIIKNVYIKYMYQIWNLYYINISKINNYMTSHFFSNLSLQLLYQLIWKKIDVI